MRSLRIILIIAIVAAVGAGGYFYSKHVSKASSSIQKSGELKDILASNQGNVLILLLGQEGCPGTAQATTILDEYASDKPSGVSIMRLDVPLPNKSPKDLPEWEHNFSRFIDEDRLVAKELDFFFYPTLYVFDKEGENRFAGGCEKKRIEFMVKEILSEKPGQEKGIYSLKMPPVGKPGPDFSAKTLKGETVTLNSLLGKKGLLVFFGRISCPFSVKALPQLNTIAGAFDDKGINTVIISQSEDPEAIRPVYGKHCPDMPVVLDQTGGICTAYGVDVTPFFFLLDNKGMVVKHRSFTHAAAVNSLNGMLGFAAEKTSLKSIEAG